MYEYMFYCESHRIDQRNEVELKLLSLFRRIFCCIFTMIGEVIIKKYCVKGHVHFLNTLGRLIIVLDKQFAQSLKSTN